MLNCIFNLYFLKNRPFSLVHFITEHCNARCEHCFLDFSNRGNFKEELSLKEIVELTKSLNGTLYNVNLTGGEPFLRNDFFEIAEAYFHNAGVKSAYISTNGMFTEKIKEFIDRFVKAKIRGKIIFSISVDNFEALHDKNRNVPGLFKNALRSFYLIKKYNSPDILANLGITIGEHNYHNLIDFYHCLRENNIDDFVIFPVREEGRIKNINPQEKKEIAQIYAKLSQLIFWDPVRKNKKSLFQALLNSKNIILNQIIRDTYLKPRFISYCTAASLFYVIRSNGEVYPCEILDAPLGNLRDFNMDFSKFLKTQKVKNCRKYVINSKCHCIYPCVWTVNILSKPNFLPGLFYYTLKQKA